MTSASASSPPLEPPWRTTSPTPMPTNTPPSNAANSGMPDRSGSIGGNRSHNPKNSDIDVVDTIDSRMNPLPRNRHASR